MIKFKEVYSYEFYRDLLRLKRFIPIHFEEVDSDDF